MSDTYQGKCFCGGVHMEVSGDPVFQGFCHCNDCRRWSGAPVTAYALWPSDQVRIVAGDDLVVDYSQTGQAVRRHCRTCGGSLMTVIPDIGISDVYPVLLDGFTSSPENHVHYTQRVMDLPDGLPKFQDLPAEAGGSGEMIED